MPNGNHPNPQPAWISGRVVETALRTRALNDDSATSVGCRKRERADDSNEGSIGSESGFESARRQGLIDSRRGVAGDVVHRDRRVRRSALRSALPRLAP